MVKYVVGFLWAIIVFLLCWTALLLIQLQNRGLLW